MLVVLDFAEKVALPSMELQSKQLHFGTGLKYDILRKNCSNVHKIFVFGLPEGHWHDTKEAKSVINMLYDVLKTIKSSQITQNATKLVLHTDNFSIQTKTAKSCGFRLE